MNYNLYAYNNNYVKIYDDNLSYSGCYFVSLTGYSPTHDYQHYYLDSGSTNNLVGVYPDCYCTGRTLFNLIQETPGFRKYYYTARGCEDGVSYYFYSPDPNLPTDKVIKIIDYDGAFETQVCVGYITKTLVDGYKIHLTGFTYDDCSECAASFPTPTPTSTPFPSPTPSALYYKLNSCSDFAPSIYTAITPGVASQRYYDYINNIYYVWDNLTTSVPGSIGSVAIISGQSGCP